MVSPQKSSGKNERHPWVVIAILVGFVLVASNLKSNEVDTRELLVTASATSHSASSSSRDAANSKDTTTTTEKAAPRNDKPLLLQMAPAIFPMDPQDPTKIKFPEMVDAVMIDIGARESDYMTALEKTLDKNVSLIMVDPLPDSVIPVISRAMKYNLQGADGRGNYPHPDTGDRAFVIRGAMSETESIQNFQMGLGPSCGSLLKTGDKNTFWCWDTKREIPVNVFRLKDLLDMIPPQIKTIHIKVDAEGADHYVLKGGFEALERADSVIIECKPPPDRPHDPKHPVSNRDGQCNDDEVTKWMCNQRDFCGHKIVPSGGASNILFWNEHKLGQISVPDYLTHEKLQWKDLYIELKEKAAKAKLAAQQ